MVIEMEFQEKLKNYVDAVICAGCNLQKGQELLIEASVDCLELVRMLTKRAYEAGAGPVTVSWSDDQISRMKYEYCDMSVFQSVPEWQRALENGMAERGAALLSITSRDPEVFKGVDHKKLTAWAVSAHRDCKQFFDSMDLGRMVWCIAAAPSPAWAKKVFPDCPEGEAVSRLWDCIFQAARADKPDAVKAWEAHRASFDRRIALLNGRKLRQLRYKNSLGTDIVLGLREDRVWIGGGDRTVNGTYFFPNMPTEEIFCSPDKDLTEGIVYGSMVLNHQGTLIDEFSITFHGGKVTDFAAKTGYDALAALLETDEGARRLGEMALIPKTSPIAQMNTLFYNTLYDENASCHFALGKGFPECIRGGREMSPETLAEKGLNESAAHTDFMLGTPDLSITGIDGEGKEVSVFENGDWSPEFR